MQAAAHAKKSTTVRSVLARSTLFGVRALGTVAPGLAEARAVEAFFTPRRRKAEEPVVAGHDARPFTVACEGERLAAWSFGEGPAILLVHGWESRGADLAQFVAPLVESGRRVVLFDQPAHGSSSGRQTTVLQMARAVRAVADVTGPLQGLVAHSLGSPAAVLAMSRGLPVGRAAFIAPAVEPDAFARQIAALFGLADVEHFVGAVYAKVGYERGTLAADLAVTRFEVPALIIHDVADREVPFDHGRRLATAWPGATLLPVEGLGHRRIVRDPEVVRRSVVFVTGAGLGEYREQVAI